MEHVVPILVSSNLNAPMIAYCYMQTGEHLFLPRVDIATHEREIST
jgi:hypothetical protein